MVKLRRMCGGALRPWRYGWKRPRREAGAVILDNLGLAIVYRDPNNDWPRQPRRRRIEPPARPW